MSGAFPFDLPTDWREPLQPQSEADSLARLRTFINDERSAGKIIYPPDGEWFRALELTAPQHVRVVILGQDPYHGPGQAHGLCFSVQPNVRIPPSLLNIFKELQADLNVPRPKHGCLEHWARQGVLLLNSVLTVEAGQAASHAGKGWECLTDAIIRIVNERDQPVVFLLWGAHAQRKAAFVDRDRHLVLTAPHPSPLSAPRGFLGCRHFSLANDWLVRQGAQPIDWSVPSV